MRHVTILESLLHFLSHHLFSLRIAALELLELANDGSPEILDSLHDGLGHIVELLLEFFDFGVNNIVVHFPATVPVDEVVVDVGFLGEALHLEAHLLLVHELGDVDDVGVHVVPAILLLQQAARAEQPIRALRVLAEVVD